MIKKIFPMLFLLFLLMNTLLANKVYASAATIDIINFDPVLASCEVSTNSELDLSNLQLSMPYALYNGTYFDVTFNYIGVTNGKLTWQLSSANIESPSLPAGCAAKVSIIDDVVLLEEIRVKNSDIVYTANLNLEISGNAILLKLNQYDELNNNGSDSSDNNTVDLNAAGSADELKLLLAVAGSDKTITLAWTSYSSNNTDGSNMIYHIHLSTLEGFTPDASTLFNTIQGQAQAELSNLTPGTKYYISIVAEDSSGVTTQSNSLTATTFANPVVINDSVTFENSDSLQLGTATVSNNQLSFTTTSQSSIPAVNTLLVGATEDSGYLRWIDSISQSGNSLQVTTRDASLNEIVSSGRLSSEVLLQDINNGNTRRHWDQSRISRLNWNKDLLQITQVEHATKEDNLQIIPSEDRQNFRIKLGSSNKREASNSLIVDAKISFNPTLATDMDWSLFNGLHSASVRTTGTLGIEVKAAYDFSASTEYKPDPKRLLSKTFRAKYFIGSVPVWQVTTVTLDIQVSASASSEVNASSTANASATFGFGGNYNNGSWSSYSNPVSTSRSLTADISVNGKVNAEVRLIPNIETTFYQAVAGNISVEPFISGELAAQALANSDLLAGLSINYIQPTAFNVNLGLECYMSVKLTKIFNSISLLDKTKVCGKDTITGDLNYALFSLPELSLVQNTSSDGSYSFTGTIKNGSNNNFDTDSIQWSIFPQGPSLSINNSSGNDFNSTMTFTPQAGVEKYIVFFSGYGGLGEIGRQYKQLEVGTEQSCDALSGNWDTSGTTTVTSGVSGVSEMQTFSSSVNGSANLAISGNAVTISFDSGSLITGTCAADGKSIAIDPPDSSQLQSELQAGGFPATSVSTVESANIVVNTNDSMSLLGPGSVQINTSVGSFTLKHTYNINFSR